MSKSFLRSLILPCAWAGLIATPALSADVEMPPDDSLLMTGWIGFSVGFEDATFPSRDEGDVHFDEGTKLTGGAHGYWSIPVGEAVSLQFDGQGELYDRSSDDNNDPDSAYIFGGHLSWRDPAAGLLGVFGGVGQGMSSDMGDHDIDYLAGIEGQLYLDSFTFYAQGGYADFKVDTDEPDGEGFVDGWFARGVGRYFFSEDFLVQAEVSYGETSSFMDGEDNGEIWNWGALARTRLLDSSVPVYGTLEYRGAHFWTEDQDDDRADKHAVLIGLDIAFGVENLWENDRRGATLDMPMLPARAAAWSESMD